MSVPYDWQDDGAFAPSRPRNNSRSDSSRPTAGGTSTQGADRERLYDVTGRSEWENRNDADKNKNKNKSNNGASGTNGSGSTGDWHQGDRLVYQLEKIEFSSDKDVLRFARAVNHLGRELHLILGMRAEELAGVLSQYKGRWFDFGMSSRVKARLVSAHLKVSAEAAKAIGVGAVKMAYAFDKHFVKPETDARRDVRKPRARKFTIGGD